MRGIIQIKQFDFTYWTPPIANSN